MKNLQIFNSEQFGEMRTVEVEGKIHFVASDVAKALGYRNTSEAIGDHCRWVVKCYIPHPQSKNKTIEVNVIPEGDIYRLVSNSELPSAEKFERWIFDEVLPSIRKTGTYSIKQKQPTDLKEKEVESKLRNSKVREANTYLKIAKAYASSPKYQEVLYAKAAEALSGKLIIALPEAGEKTYSATEMGLMFGVSARRIGMLANEHKLKIPEYGRLFISKSEHSVKEVETWRYYESAIPVFTRLLSKVGAAI